MLHTVLMIFAIYSIAFTIRQASILDSVRNYLTRNSVFFYKLISCAHCTGWHAGWIAYFLFNKLSSLTFSDFMLWTFAGAAISLVMDGVVNKLYGEST